jgi:hypothetical protein
VKLTEGSDADSDELINKEGRKKERKKETGKLVPSSEFNALLKFV